MKNNLRKANCCLTCIHRATKTVEELEVFCNLDKTLDVTIEPISLERIKWESEHFVESDNICDDFQRDTFAYA